MPDIAPASECTVNSLYNASRVAYGFGKSKMVLEHPIPNPPISSNSVDHLKYQDNLAELKAQGYKMYTPPNFHPKTGIGVIAFINEKNANAPIIIAYRGTATNGDVAEDINLTLTGTIGKNYRDDAFDFYTAIKNKFPNRNIALTGHSLGGHIAQYVGAKAYAQKANHEIHVRTFNSAAIDTVYKKALKKNFGAQSRFVNYRLDGDVVSILQQRVGNTYTFARAPGMKLTEAHYLKSMKSSLPQALLDSPVASTPVDKLKEELLCMRHHYNCRVNNQIFSAWRQGRKKNELIHHSIEHILTSLNASTPKDSIKLSNAITELELLKKQLDYGKSVELINYLIESAKLLHQQEFKTQVRSVAGRERTLGRQKTRDFPSHEEKDSFSDDDSKRPPH